MEPEYHSHKFEFFKNVPKQKFSWRELGYTVASFCVFMSSFVLPVAYFQNYKNIPVASHPTSKIATVMKCDNKNSELYCYTEKTTFKHID